MKGRSSGEGSGRRRGDPRGVGRRRKVKREGRRGNQGVQFSGQVFLPNLFVADLIAGAPLDLARLLNPIE